MAKRGKADLKEGIIQIYHKITVNNSNINEFNNISIYNHYFKHN